MEDDIHLDIKRLSKATSRMFVYCEVVRMSSWKLQMAAVVIVRTELTICKLYTYLFSDFSKELLY